MATELSSYASNLDPVHRERYLEKIQIISVDPYTLDMDEASSDIKDFPNIMYPDLVNYFVYGKSAYTMNEMKSYKSLEAYNQSVCGWVKKVAVKHFSDYVLILGKVMHSQRLSQAHLSPWTITKKDGSIISAHCDCIAGLSEACTHVAALLFTVDSAVRSVEESTVTGVRAYWKPPTGKPGDPRRLADIDLSSAKRRRLDEPLRVRGESESGSALSVEEQQLLLEKLSTSTDGCVLHKVRKPFSERINAEMEKKKKLTFTQFYKKEYEDKDLDYLRTLGESSTIVLSEEEAKMMEAETRHQYKARSWWLYRAGRITASIFKRACRTTVEKPSVSLIKQICYPSTYRAKVRAIDYGCEHESVALQNFKYFMSNHENVQVEKCGLFIDPQMPMFGATPDALVSCDCCGSGIVEIKCPFCAKDSGVLSQMERKNFFLCWKNGEIILDQEHPYFYQIQMQLAVSKREFCYLVAWSHTDLVVKKISFDSEFFNKESSLAKTFFYKVIFPELLGKYFTRSESCEEPQQSNPEEVLVDLGYDDIGDAEFSSDKEPSPYECGGAVLQERDESGKEGEELQLEPDEETGRHSWDMCPVCNRGTEGGSMVQCLAANCDLWYHLTCVGLEGPPVGMWYCDNCIDYL